MLKWEHSSRLALLFLGFGTSIGSKASGKVIIYYSTHRTISLSLYILVNMSIVVCFGVENTPFSLDLSPVMLGM